MPSDDSISFGMNQLLREYSDSISSQIHRRASEEGSRMYQTGLQNVILGVIADCNEFFRNVPIGERRHISPNCLLGELITGLNMRGSNSLGELHRELVQKLVEIAKIELRNQYPFSGTFSFMRCQENFRNSGDSSETRSINRAHSIGVMIALAKKQSGEPVSLVELNRADATIREMATIGDFGAGRPPTPDVAFERAESEYGGVKFDATNIKITCKPTLSEEKLEAVQLAGEAALGALLNGEYEVAVAQFEIAINILKGELTPKAEDKPRPKQKARQSAPNPMDGMWNLSDMVERIARIQNARDDEREPPF